MLAKYYRPPHSDASVPNPYPTVKEQTSFEKGLVDKTAKTTNDIILYDGRIVVFKAEGDVMLYVVGGMDENELLLWHTLLALRDSLNVLLKYVHTPPSPPLRMWCVRLLIRTRNVTDKRTIVENYDIVSLAVDEIVDDGVILETDPTVIVSRVSKPPQHEVAGVKGIDLSEQGLLNVWEFGKKQLAERLRQGL